MGIPLAAPRLDSELSRGGPPRQAPRVLVAVGDSRQGVRLRKHLLAAGKVADLTGSGEEAVHLAVERSYEALVVALRLLKFDGLEVVRRLRERLVSIPLLLLVPPSEAEAGIAGLDAGADDFLLEPPSVPELLARLRARVRDRHHGRGDVLCVEDLEMDLRKRSIHRRGREVGLTNRELAVLEVLMRQSPCPVSKATVLERVWGEGQDRPEQRGPRRRQPPPQQDQPTRRPPAAAHRPRRRLRPSP